MANGFYRGPTRKRASEAQLEEDGFAVVPKPHIHYSSSDDAKQQTHQASWEVVWPRWLLNVRAWLNEFTLGVGVGCSKILGILTGSLEDKMVA